MALTYQKAGVDYSILDQIKKMAQRKARATGKNLPGTLWKKVEQSRGETAYLLEGSDCYWAFVIEGLGTKALVAEKMGEKTGKFFSYYQAIAQDTVAAIINDLVALGADPLVLLAYWAVGEVDWWKKKEKAEGLISGWRKACDFSGCLWGGGETPVLKGVIFPQAVDLAGAAWGIVEPKERVILGEKIVPDDRIIFFESSGLHANGFSLVRKIAEKLPKGYQTTLPSGQTFGEALLVPSLNYSRLIKNFLKEKVEIHYLVPVTGHGWRKLLRPPKKIRCVIENIPPVPEVFDFLQKHSGLSEKEMYGTFNMGVGLAAFLPEKEEKKVLALAEKNKIRAWVAGWIEAGEKELIIKPKNLCYPGKELKIRLGKRTL